MELGEYTVGLLFLAGTWGASLAAAAIAVVRAFPRLAGAPRLLAFATLGLAALVLVHLLPGALGILSRWTALAAAGLLLAAVWRWLPHAPGAPVDDTPPPMRESGPVSWVLAALGVAAAAVFAVAEARTAIRLASHDIDSLTFHLPNIGRWMQSGSLWQFDQFIPLQAHGGYPHNGDLVYLSVVEPFRSDAFVRLVGVPFVFVAGMAAYAIGRELRAPRATALLAAAAFASLPVVIEPMWAGARTDPIELAAFGAGVLFTLRHLRLRRTGDLVLAGVALGLALGTKWYGVSSVVIVLAVWAAATLIAQRSLRPVVTGGGALCGLIALGGGFWFLRNGVETPSPLFPVSVPVLWEAPRDYVRDCLGFSVSDYFGDTRILKDYLWPAWRESYGGLGAVAVAGAVAAAAFAIAARDRAAVTASVLVAGLAAAYTITPYTALGVEDEPIVAAANTRYLAPALLVALPLAAWAIGRLGRARIVGEAVMLIALGDGLRRAYEVPVSHVAAAAVLLVAAGALVYGLYLVRGRVPKPRVVMPVAAAVVLVLIALLGLNRLRAFEAERYTDDDPVIAELLRRAPADRRIGLAGARDVTEIAPIWPAFGKRVDNRVEYVGRFVDGQLREYDDAASWADAVRRGRYDYVLVGRGAYPQGCEFPGRDSDDDAFARAAGLRRLASAGQLTLYEVPRGMIGAR